MARDEHHPAAASAVPEAPAVTRRPAGPREAAVIGPSIMIDGDLRGEEDLIIEGQVSGTVQLKNNSLTIGSQGKVKADLYAHSIFVEGYMEGDLYGSERVCVKKSAQVRGNITSPRVSLDDGARFKGTIEMDPQAVEAALGTRRSGPTPIDTGSKIAPGAAKGDGAPGHKPETAAGGKRG
ncbi:MAG TPA: polymer-forming cytoskeletal protein [Gammaproteobacteria bacterium]|nr:polymer-forming cytoskeletal protein [Gammaproteobacteria bacterium]